MRIDEIKESPRKKGRFLVKLADGDVLRVTAEELVRFDLEAGRELDGEALEALRAAARTAAVRTQAANIVGSRALSKKELTRRLIRKGSGADDAQAAADWLEDIGAVDDAGYAASLARHYGGMGYGPGKVREELRRRGVDRSLWDGALEELPQAAEALDRLMQRKCRGDLSDPKERRRIAGVLARRGFGWDEVRSAMERYGGSIEDD